MHQFAHDAPIEQSYRWVLACALLFGVLAGVLIPTIGVQAQAMEPQTYTVLAGDGSFFNSQVLAFGPQALQVHRGDTVMWRITGGFHNVHFEQRPSELIIAPEVNGDAVPQLNPAIWRYAMDDASQGNIDNLISTANSLVKKEQEAINKVCDLLTT